MNVKASIWLCDLTHTYQTVAMNRIPLGIGMVASYCKKVLGDKVSVRLFKFPNKLQKALSENPAPMVIGFANYVWNQNLNLEASRRIKALYPQVNIVFGGPNFPSEVEKQREFLNKAPWIDFYVPYEGEGAFADLVDLLIQTNGDCEKTKQLNPLNTVFMNGETLVQEKLNQRINLNDVPSPYLAGYLDEFFEDLKPLIQMTRGCSFSCAYCTEGLKHWNRVVRQNPETIAKELEYVAEHVDKSEDLFIADSNFGMYKQDIEHCHIIADIQDRFSWPRYIHVATGKNNKERILEAAHIIRGALRLSASVQSTDPVVLRNIHRQNISLQKILELGKEANKTGANTYSELILALPGDSIKAHLQSLKDVLDAGLLTIRPFTLMLLEGTELSTQKAKKKYQMLVKYRILPRCFGRYPWMNGDEDIVTVEIEEVCVGNSTLSFEDYLQCRLFHLTIEVFYNDGILSDLYIVLSKFEISVFDFLNCIHFNYMHTRLNEVYNEFSRETRDELWDSPQEIIDFISEPENLDKYKKGEYGANLLFKYKTLAFIKYMNVVLDIAYDTALEMIRNRQKTSSEDMGKTIEFLSQLKRFNKHKSVEFLDTEKVIEDHFNFNFVNFNELDKTFMKGQGERYTFRFYHDSQQKKIIEFNKKFFGEDIIGLSRLLSQVYVKKCFRITDCEVIKQ